ncbi:hypothetical protein, partial [Listeria monocytogenes]|uniref:hypothetical protein n=1 Tax=Listeria monocytogenes TaxID=1639 RepID=UPI001C54464D
MILAHKKTDAEKGVNRIGQKREFGIFILKGGRRMKILCLFLAYDYILTKFGGAGGGGGVGWGEG